jgi:hypothetical protein
MSLIIQSMHEAILAGLNKCATHYQQPLADVQIVFRMDEHEDLKFYTCIKQVMKASVQLQDLIGKRPYNFLVRNHIRGLLRKYAKKTGIALSQVNLMTGIKDKPDEIYVWLRNNSELIREISDHAELE